MIEAYNYDKRLWMLLYRIIKKTVNSYDKDNLKEKL
jgi:hypothetical protein